MEQAQQHGGKRRLPGPAVIQQDLMKLGKAVVIRQAALRHISHQHNGDDDFVGGKPKQEGHEDHPINAQKPPEGIAERGTVLQKTGPAAVYICQNPDEKPCRGSYNNRPAENKEGAVQNRVYDYAADFRHPVWRQFQNKGRRQSF